jgi:interleukin enhancer-binding factor 2
MSHFKAVESVKHANWFEIEASDNTVRIMVRIIKDIRERYSLLRPLSPWMIDLLCHHSVLSNPTGESLPLGKAFRRLIQGLNSISYDSFKDDVIHVV